MKVSNIASLKLKKGLNVIDVGSVELGDVVTLYEILTKYDIKILISEEDLERLGFSPH